MSLIHLLESYESTVYLLTVALSLTFGTVVLTLRHNAIILREKKWATPFAVTFFMLAGIYSLLLMDLWVSPSHAAPRPNLSYLLRAVMSIGSGVTNFLFFRSAYQLAEPVINKRWLLSVKRLRLGGVFTWPALLLLLCAAGLLMSAESLWGWGVWVKAPDAVFSALALFLMGYVLYHSISYRHDERMAKVAFFASLCYAVLYLFYGLTITQHIVSGGLADPGEAEHIAGLLTAIISLALKFGIFFPAYSLMLLVSGPLEGVDRMLKPITGQNKEYLESAGVVKSICDELRVNAVKLYIKRPGPDDQRVVLCAYPPLPPAPTGDNQGPREVKYEKGAHYDLVLRTGEPYIDSSHNRLIRKISQVAVPVRFHKSIIAVLHVERGRRNFTDADVINLKRIATMVSPAVQAYREMDALQRVGQELSQLQIKVKEYDMRRDIGDITRRMHDAISPLATGVSIEIGFTEYQGTYPSDGALGESVKRRLTAALGEEDETDQEGHRWFTTGLKIPIGNAKGEKDGEQVFGKFIILPESERIKSARVTVGTNPTFRYVLSDLLTETLLNFIRGRLNRLTDKLGSRLSGLKGTDTESWHAEVENTAREARLLWVVARTPEREDLHGENEMVLHGEDEVKRLVEYLEGPEQREQCELKAENLWLYSLEEPQLETHHVIKKYLKESRTTLWFGVARQGFGPELNYVSPWRYFLDHFCEIADSALRRIQMMKREEKQNTRMLLVLSTFGVTVDNGALLHDMLNHVQALMIPLQSLRSVINNGGQQFRPRMNAAVDNLENVQRQLESEVTHLKDAAGRNNRSPCSLNEVIDDIRDELKNELAEQAIDLKVEVPQGTVAYARYGVTRSALKTILVNAKEALQYDPVPNKEIRITARTVAGQLICDISDNGPGVSEEVKPKLLEAVSPSTTKPNSHGIGLMLSRIAMLVSGGDIILLEQGEERGATFRVKFPRQKISANGNGAKAFS